MAEGAVQGTGTCSEWLRWWVGYYAATPFYALADLGGKAEKVGRRIVTWSERAGSPEGSSLSAPAISEDAPSTSENDDYRQQS